MFEPYLFFLFAHCLTYFPILSNHIEYDYLYEHSISLLVVISEAGFLIF